MSAFASPFRALLATGYYDGAEHGYALGLGGDAFAFEMLGSDVEGDLRVFRVSRIAAWPAAALEAHAPWEHGHARLMPPHSGDALERILADCDVNAVEHAIVAAVDLMSGVHGWWPITDAVRGDAQWQTELVADLVRRAVAVRKARTDEFAVYGDDAQIHRGVTALVVDLRSSLPSGRLLVQEHLQYHDEIIPHLFMDDLCVLVLDQQDAVARERDLTVLSGAFERALLRAKTEGQDSTWWPYLVNLLSVSWFEGIEVAPAVLASFLAVSQALVLEQYAGFVRDSELVAQQVRAARGQRPN